METKQRQLPSLVNALGIDTLFGRMLVLSIIIHAIWSTLFLFPWHAGFNGAAAPFLDLNMRMAAQSASPPASRQAKPAAADPVNIKDEATPLSPPKDAPALSEYDKLREDVQKTLDSAAGQPAAVHRDSLGLGMTSGYFSSFGEGKTLRGDIREYYFEMLRRINEKWWLSNNNIPGARNKATVFVVIARNGMLVAMRLVESSGNPQFDKAILQVLEAASPLPPLPETYHEDFFEAPLRFHLPLNLMESLKIG